jgi:hypothetical protein
MRLLHDGPRRFFDFVILRSGWPNDIARELVDKIAKVVLLLRQVEAKH